MAYGDGGISPGYGDNRAGVGGYVSVTAETNTKPSQYDSLDSIIFSDEAEAMYAQGSPIVLMNRIYNPVSKNFINTTNAFSPRSNWEICLKVLFTEYFVDPNCGVGLAGMVTTNLTGNNRNINFYLNQNYGISCELSSDGTSWNLGTLSTNTPVPLNTEVYVKVVREDNTYKMYYGTDLDRLTLTSTISSSTDVYPSSLWFAFGGDYQGGSAWTNSSTGNYNYWKGYIDVKESYIKIDGEKVFGGKQVVTGTFFPKTWMNLYSDGWCEQTLIINALAEGNKSQTFFKEIDTNQPYLMTVSGVISNVSFNGITATYHHDTGYGHLTIKGYLKST